MWMDEKLRTDWDTFYVGGARTKEGWDCERDYIYFCLFLWDLGFKLAAFFGRWSIKGVRFEARSMFIYVGLYPILYLAATYLPLCFC